MYAGKSPIPPCGYFACPIPAFDRDLGDLRREDGAEELAAMGIRGSEKKAALKINAPDTGKTDSKIHGCSWLWAGRGGDYTAGVSVVPLLVARCFISAMASWTASTFSATVLATSAYESPTAELAPASAAAIIGPNFSLR